MKKITLIAFLFLVKFGVQAQDLQLPSLDLKTAEDFTKSEGDISKVADYLAVAPVGKDTVTQQKATNLLSSWVTKAPMLGGLDVLGPISKLTVGNPGLTGNFLGGFVKSAISSKLSFDKVASLVAGVKSMLAVYKLGNGIKQNAGLDKLVQMDKMGQLGNFVKSSFKL